MKADIDTSVSIRSPMPLPNALNIFNDITLITDPLSRIKISVNIDISVIGFHGYIENIGGYFYKNFGK